MRMAITLVRKAGYSVTIAAAVAFSSTAPAAPLSLPDTPLFLSAGAQPNLIMAIDDSGSMDFETLFPGNDGAAWWRNGDSGNCTAVGDDSFVGCVSNSTGTTDIPAAGRLNFNNGGNSSGTWKKFSYLFPNGYNNANDSGRRRLADSTNDHFAIPPLPAFAWSRSPVYNAAYFNPEATYTPWVNGGGYSFTDATPTAARFDPVFETSITINLTQDMAGVGNADPAAACTNSALPNRGDNFYFRVYSGMTLPSGTCFRSSLGDNTGNWQVVRTQGCRVGVNNECFTNDNGTNRTLTLPNDARVAIRYFPATFYLPASVSLPANYGYTGTVLTGGVAPDGTALNGYQIKPTNFASTNQYDAAIKNFANWFQFYRKRHQALRAGLGESFKTLTGLRVDGFTINNRQDVTMASIDNAANRADLYRKFYTEWVRSGGTPNRSAVARIIDNFKRTDANAPVTLACQKNFGMLFTDGFSNAPTAGDGIQGVYGNVDQNQDSPYADSYAGSLADAVMSAYINPLRSGAGFPSGQVSPQRGCPTSGTYPGGPLDCNRDLHMNFYAVTLGTRGLLFNSDTTLDPYANPPTWPTTFPARHPSAVDDLWHATINGRGQLLNARSPQEIATKLQAVLSSITSQTSTAAAASVNGSRINAGSRVYQPRFDSSNWTGQILSYSVTPSTGELSPPSNLASVPTASNRNIYTRNTARQPVEFTWAALQSDTDRVALLDPNRDAAEAERMLNYLRGDSTNEVSSDGRRGKYRRRVERNDTPNKLGDIVGSAPLYIAAPPFRYRDSLESAPYSAFAATNRNRTPMIYVGANDGMLHAFNASTGVEAFAYIPGAVFPKLRNLAAQDYGHQFYVDGPPSMGDAFFARNGRSAWRTVLAGGLNKGGQGVYAIDVTDPSSISASSMFLEFTDANDRDLGFTYSQPQIAKFRDNNWYLVFGNGYNSTFDDGNASTTGNAVLFMIDLGSGVVRKIDTGVGNAQRPTGIAYDNGMSTPVLADMDGDGVVEAVYAGDLFGNMWKFDVSATDPGSWGVAFGRTPLFVARTDSGQVQPITVRPEVTRGPTGAGTMVVFGTGKYLEPSDKSRTPRVDQSFYGILDFNAAVTYSSRQSVLTRQTILSHLTVSKQAPGGGTITSTLRVTSDNPLGGNQGWFIDLVSPGDTYQAEKQVTNPQIRDNRVIFTTLIPDQDPCGFGGTGWLMELDVRDGSRLDDSPFDLNRDGLFTSEDNVTVVPATSTSPAMSGASSGLLSQEGVPQMPIITYGNFGEGDQAKPVQYKYMPGSSGNMQMVIENPGPNATGRQSWRQIR